VVGAHARRDPRGADRRVRRGAGPARARRARRHRGGRRGAVPAVQPGGQHRHHPGRARHQGRGGGQDRGGGVTHHRRLAGARDGRRLPGRDRGGHLGRGGRRALRAGADRRLARRRPGQAGRGRPGAGRDRGARAAAADARPARHYGNRPRSARPGPGAEMSTDPVTVIPVTGLPEISAGADLAGLIAAAVPDLRDGDILVVTSKIVSKAEGRVVTADRDDAIEAETARVVARRGVTTIAQTRHGFVLAAAGVDESNTAPGTVVLLPEDPDESARRLRKSLRDRAGASVGVIITDTMGRPWRAGQTDTAIGAAGVVVMRDHRGEKDVFGKTLEVTVAAVADEIAAAGDLVKGKALQIPVALVRGLEGLVTAEDGPGARALVRPAAEDMF